MFVFIFGRALISREFGSDKCVEADLQRAIERAKPGKHPPIPGFRRSRRGVVIGRKKG
jgi:hypothetical protein